MGMVIFAPFIHARLLNALL